MRVLFVGGTGVISSACGQLALERGIELYLLNRGTGRRPVPEGARVLRGDIRDRDSVRDAIGQRDFDVVVDWVAYTPEHVTTDIELFRDRTRQYVFISTAAVYQKPPVLLPITESTPFEYTLWDYARAKIACEDVIANACRAKFPATIVRPSHTYDQTKLPLQGGYTMVDRMRRGDPVIVHGDGSSLWTLTHHRDFAKGFVGLLGNPHAIGETFHITSDEVLTWNQIYETIGRAAGALPRLVHVPSDYIAAFDAQWGAGLLGDKCHSVIFDNTKIKRAVPGFTATIPFAQGASEILAWFDADPARRVVDRDLDRTIDRIIAAHESTRPQAV